MFERGLRDEIYTSVAASIFDTYAKVVESARSVELIAPKPKPKEAQAPKAKVEETRKDQKPWNQNFGKRPWNKDSGNSGGSWKKQRTDDQAGGKPFSGVCCNCR